VSESPWRSLFETVRGALHNRRDERGVVGSINWLRQGMTERGANPNVVRNIIYRNKGKLADKRVLFSLLSELWESTGGAPLEAPETELLLGSTPDEGEAVQLLGRDKRRVYNSFVGAVRSGTRPKLLVTGRPGSGKTLLTDYIQRALELPTQSAQDTGLEIGLKTTAVVRQEFSAVNLADALQRLSLALGATPELFEAKLVKVGVAGAYSVQADAQAEVARVVREPLRGRRDPLTLLLHVSQSTGGAQPGTLGDAPLRLSTPDVPRVGLTEWLWHTLLEPLGRLNHISLLVSMSELPLTLAGRTETFEGPVKLSPPTTAEARRFVRALAPGLPDAQQEDLVGRAKRSFEDLRTLTLLAEAREPLDNSRDSGRDSGRHTERLGQLVAVGSGRLRDFLEVLAVLSLPEFPAVTQNALEALRQAEPRSLNTLELAFLDAVPGEPDCWRPFSRQFSRTLRGRLYAADPERFRTLNRAASHFYESNAHRAPRSDAAGRYAYHLFAARAWGELTRWAEHAPIPQALLQRLWRTAQAELKDPVLLGTVALRVASYYVRLGSPEHPDALAALTVLAASDDPELRAWTLVKRAESAMLGGRYGETETLLESWQDVGDAGLAVEVTLLRANLARWHSRLSDAAALAQRSADALAQLNAAQHGAPPDPLLSVRVGLWLGIVAKDKGALEDALGHFRRVATGDELLRARVHFQEADVLFSLGRLAEAHTALTGAVNLSYQGEAPAFERARYLARRGTLRRRRGDFVAAHADFAAADAALTDAATDTETTRSSFRLSFEGAKVRDEAALNLLARGRADEAVAALQADLEAFAAYGRHYGVDPSFRILRGSLRLAVAYGCRALGRRYRLPFSLYPEAAAVSADLQWARQLARAVLKTLGDEPERYVGLVTQAQLTASLLLLPKDAVAQAETALSRARYPYGRAQAGAHLAGALLRSRDIEGARAVVAAAEHDAQLAETDDAALLAYLTLLDAAARLCSGDPGGAHEGIFGALRRPQLEPYHDALLRDFGELAERLDVSPSAAALGLGDAPLPRTLRPADALVLRLQQQRQEGAIAEPVKTTR